MHFNSTWFGTKIWVGHALGSCAITNQANLSKSHRNSTGCILINWTVFKSVVHERRKESIYKQTFVCLPPLRGFWASYQYPNWFSSNHTVSFISQEWKMLGPCSYMTLPCKTIKSIIHSLGTFYESVFCCSLAHLSSPSHRLPKTWE